MLVPVSWGSRRVKPSEVPAESEMNDASFGDDVSGEAVLGEPEEGELDVSWPLSLGGVVRF